MIKRSRTQFVFSRTTSKSRPILGRGSSALTLDTHFQAMALNIHKQAMGNYELLLRAGHILTAKEAIQEIRRADRRGGIAVGEFHASLRQLIHARTFMKSGTVSS